MRVRTSFFAGPLGTARSCALPAAWLRSAARPAVTYGSFGLALREGPAFRVSFAAQPRAPPSGFAEQSVPFGGLWPPPLSTYAPDATLSRGKVDPSTPQESGTYGERDGSKRGLHGSNVIRLNIFNKLTERSLP